MERLAVTLVLFALVASQSLRASHAFADEKPELPIAAYLDESQGNGEVDPAEAPPTSVAEWMAQPRTNEAVEPVARIAPAAPPSELKKVALPPYVIEPPDILAIEGIKLVPQAPHRLVVGDAVEIRVPGALPEFPIAGEFPVDAGGYVSLGLAYGRYKLADLTVDEAQAHIHEDLTRRFQLADAEVVVSLSATDDVQKITGQHLVAMDGRVNLGVHGSVFVAGMTIAEARAAIEKCLAKDFREPTVSVDVLAYNSKVYYIITKGAGLGDDVVRCPITGNETVLDAVANMGGISSLGLKRMWVARPAANGIGEEVVLPVDWDGISKGTSVATNYQLFPGDRLFIEPKERAKEPTAKTAAEAPTVRLALMQEGSKPWRQELPFTPDMTVGDLLQAATYLQPIDFGKAQITHGRVTGPPGAHSYTTTAIGWDNEQLQPNEKDNCELAAGDEVTVELPASTPESGGNPTLAPVRASAATRPAPSVANPFVVAPPAVRLAAHEDPAAVDNATSTPKPQDRELKLHDIITVHVVDVGKSDDDAPTEFRIACVISEVLPNGNLRIDGQQSILSYNEEWTVLLSGQVHPGAVAADRTISSRLVADLDLTNRAVKIFTVDGAEDVTADDVAQVKFNVSILRDLSGELGELGTCREDGGPKFVDSDTLREAVESLKKRDLVKVVAEPSVVTAVGRPASLEISGTAPAQKVEGAEPTGPVAIEVVPRELSLDQNGFRVNVNLRVTKGGDLQCETGIPLDETLIHPLHGPQSSGSTDSGTTYLVITPELVQ